MTLLHLSPSDTVRFWKNVDVKGPNECWNWTGATGGGGRFDWYGVFRRSRTDHRERGGPYKLYAHRLSWLLARGWPVEYLVPSTAVMHTCDNHFCCNPGHLELGTQLHNIQDMIRKGRHRVGRKKKQELPV